jgi:hypothetical protein
MLVKSPTPSKLTEMPAPIVAALDQESPIKRTILLTSGPAGRWLPTRESPSHIDLPRGSDPTIQFGSHGSCILVA